MKNLVLKVAKEKNVMSLISGLSSSFLGLLSFMVLSRTLNQVLFGDWVLFITLAGFFDMMRFGLTSTALVKFASTDNISEREAYLGSSFKIGLFTAILLSLVLWLIYAVLGLSNVSLNNGYRLFLIYYPVLALINLSWNNSVSYFQAIQNFKNILHLRLIVNGSFVLFLVMNLLLFKFGLTEILVAYIVSNLFPSIFVFLKRWDGLMHLGKATKHTTSTMLKFGKYSMGTLVGSSLLKSADTVIIGLSPVLGSVGVALYAIPLKLIDLLSIPLRSFSIAAFPKMAQKHNQKDTEGLKSIFYEYSGALTLLFIPIALILFFLAEPLILIVGGASYNESMPVLKGIFFVFLFYSVIQPADRFTGVLLDSIDKPKFNFYKVLLMATANIVGDIIAVFYFKSLIAVAVVTVSFTVLGVFAGYIFTSKFIDINIIKTIKSGGLFYKKLWKDINRKVKTELK